MFSVQAATETRFRPTCTACYKIVDTETFSDPFNKRGGAVCKSSSIVVAK